MNLPDFSYRVRVLYMNGYSVRQISIITGCDDYRAIKKHAPMSTQANRETYGLRPLRIEYAIKIGMWIHFLRECRKAIRATLSKPVSIYTMDGGGVDNDGRQHAGWHDTTASDAKTPLELLMEKEEMENESRA